MLLWAAAPAARRAAWKPNSGRVPRPPRRAECQEGVTQHRVPLRRGSCSPQHWVQRGLKTVSRHVGDEGITRRGTPCRSAWQQESWWSPLPVTAGPLTLVASSFSLWLHRGSWCPVLLSGLKTRSCGSLHLGAVSAGTPVTGWCWLESLSNLGGSPSCWGPGGWHRGALVFLCWGSWHEAFGLALGCWLVGLRTLLPSPLISRPKPQRWARAACAVSELAERGGGASEGSSILGSGQR